MPTKQEMFRFVSVRQAERARRYRVEGRLVRDLRPVSGASVLTVLFGPGPFPAKLSAAEDGAASDRFVAADDPVAVGLEPMVDFFRRELTPGRSLADLLAAFAAEFPQLTALLQQVPPAPILQVTLELIDRLWDSFYVLVTLGFDRYVRTEYLADALRVYHVLRVWWQHIVTQRTTWSGGAFDEYELIIDLVAAAEPSRDLAAAKSAATVPGVGVEGPTFRVPLQVGDIIPPTVGDLLLVEQDLRGYRLGELAAIETVMRGERRERTIRTLARTTQTTTTESLTEEEQTSSVSTDERFSQAFQAQKTASTSLGIEAGVSASGKFGPVQVSASVNASFTTAKSSTESVAQEYAKEVSEEATRRVSTSIRESSSVTVLNESQDTTLRGFNNEDGTEHVNGIYRWVDAEYEARLLNYGRRLMFTLDVPEPSALYLARLAQNEAEELAGLVEPVPLNRVNPGDGKPLPADSTLDGVTSFEDVLESNYAALTALYEVASELPPTEKIVGSKAFATPEPMEARKVDEHSDEKNELSQVTADNSLTIDPDYQLDEIGVFAPRGKLGTLGWYADALKLGEHKNVNRILIQVADHEFYFSAVGTGGGHDIDDTFNKMVPIHPNSPLRGPFQPTLSIATVKDFEGIDSFTLVYSASRRPETLDAWRARVFASLVAGYQRKKQAYDQAITAARAKATVATQEQTFQLRADQYRQIELTELKRGSIELLTRGSGAGSTVISFDDDGLPYIVFDEAEGAALADWRPALAHGAVSQYMETALQWDQAVYTFHPYYWAGRERWTALSGTSGSDPVFETFLRAGSATVVVPARPGYERSLLVFERTSRIFGGGYLPLFTDQAVLDVWTDVELATQLDPAEQVGETWDVTVPTSMIMLQDGDGLPEFPAEEEPADDEPESETPPTGGENAPF